MPRFFISLLLSALLLGQAAAQNSVVFAQAPTRTTSTTTLLGVAERALDGLVSISTTPARPSGTNNTFLRSALRLLSDQGTGVLISDAGEVLTSARLVHGHETVTVKFRNGQTYQAKVIGTQPLHDLALLKVENLPASLARPVPLGDSSRVTTGQKLIALGLTPGGGFSAQEVTVKTTSVTTRNDFTIDTPVSPTGYGGPLLNAAGEIVALNTGRLVNPFSPPFAFITSSVILPANDARTVLSELRSGQQPQPD